MLPLVLPLAILALPFLDLVLAFVRRTYAGQVVVRAPTSSTCTTGCSSAGTASAGPCC